MQRKSPGFTLIELMITIAVIGILAAVAYPVYTDSITKSRRADAKAKLMEVAQRQERFYTERNLYTATLSELGYASGTLRSDSGYYTITVAATSGAGNTIANSFTLTATPTGSQANDEKCRNFTLTHTNVKGISGSGTATDCW